VHAPCAPAFDVLARRRAGRAYPDSGSKASISVLTAGRARPTCWPTLTRPRARARADEFHPGGGDGFFCGPAIVRWRRDLAGRAADKGTGMRANGRSRRVSVGGGAIRAPGVFGKWMGGRSQRSAISVQRSETGFACFFCRR
jgi:hypothetical protein